MTNSTNWASHKTPEEIRADMVEGAKALGASPENAERFVAHLTGEKPMSDTQMIWMILDAARAKEQS
jgi:hypothetical protein